ncbi:ABC transporter permease [Sporosarcina pasteurii]|uniref:Bicarbonate transport system permease protein CmpB n=1 Tax=Sporosarcina pasteurii TaxID=1474 RepID=A0A380C746_SPOPA|nr:ABC transporter permease [Sporosarcina pasteurii]MDS9472986.1 ABC transporter permease [Sporosarcina pasteurii]QBQ04501.1 ABC transporter permease [Sporosarcina pasteurii]SUJ14465.1 Bicarbonate transport system permease protein CmpB [Sporosarcina pasteurii]
MRNTASFLIVVGFLILWEISARIIDKAFILPSPLQIFIRLWELKEVLFLDHLPITLLSIVMGLTLSIILGTAIAVWMSLNSSVQRAIYPILIASQMVPVIALAPIFVLWFGYTIWSKVAVAVLITFFPITVNTFDGLSSGNKDNEELFLTMGATKKDIFFKYSIPMALPHFFSGLKVAVTLSVIGAAIGEWLGAQAGLGYFSRRMMTQFDGAAVFAPIIVLTFVGILLFICVTHLEKRMLNWRTKS